jgi:hypothetical protein
MRREGNTGGNGAPSSIIAGPVIGSIDGYMRIAKARFKTIRENFPVEKFIGIEV